MGAFACASGIMGKKLGWRSGQRIAGGRSLSIFQDELKFEPMTARRRLLMKSELAGLVFVAVLLVLAVAFMVEKDSMGKALEGWLDPLFAPLGMALKDFLYGYVGPFFVNYVGEPVSKFLNWIGLANWMRDLEFFGAGLGAALKEIFQVVLPFTPAITLLAYHNGLFGSKARIKGQRTVIAEEFRKWWILHFGPKIELALFKKRSLFKEVLFLISFLALSGAAIFLFTSGLLRDVFPGYFIREADNGSIYWFFACLRDAHFSVPIDWINYMKNEMHLTEPLREITHDKLKLGYELFIDPTHTFIVASQRMPEDLFRFRIFGAAVCAMVSMVPFALMLSSWGLDRLYQSSLVVTPSLLMLKRKFVFTLIQKYKWEDLLSIVKVEGQNDVFELIFRDKSNGQSESQLKQCRLKIDLRDFKDDDRKLFFQAIDELAGACDVSDEIRKDYFPSPKESSVAYTLFWEEALASRRKSTVFVPLKEGDNLADGRITVQRQLAGQGWAATYLARMNERLVVLRESHLSTESEQSRKAAEMLQRESKILLSLKHKSIAEVLDSFVENGRNYLVLEYVPGRDLRQQVALAGALPQSTVIKMAIQICSILEYLHEQDPAVIHRDLSPDNLVITEHGDICLIDFGASKQSIENATGTLIGKQAFMAPEQLRGKASVKSDIYALGATLYWLLTATEPMALSQSYPKSKSAEISNALDDLIAEMTAFEANERPVSVAEIKARLQQIPLEDEPGAVISLAKKMSEICKVAATPFKTLREEAERD